jgi:ABC-type lipoprotein export system ATPase subunit
MAGDQRPAVLELVGVIKGYGALRPLRIRSLVLPSGAIVALMGIDAAGAEILINLITGATLPDEGEVRVYGRSSSSIADSDEWLGSLDRFGIFSDRAVLLDQLTAAQNLAMTRTLVVEPLDPSARDAVDQLAQDVSLDRGLLDVRAGELDAAARARLRLGRAASLGPSILLMEHPSASLSPKDAPPFAGDVRRLAERRGLTVLAVTADEAFAAALTRDVRTLQPATGELTTRPGTPWARVRRLLGR